MTTSAHPRRFGLLLLVFVLSGFAGLIYQSIWSHYLGLFLGHAAYAQALVLALFMGGMALGAGLVGRYGVRWRNLVRTYAAIEAVIGVMGLVFHVVFIGAIGLSFDVIMPALGHPDLVNTYKWVLAGALILPQTILLGMTFPLMSGGLIRRFPGKDGSALGGLYFANSIGAATGVLVAAFMLLPQFGLPGAMVAAGMINLFVAGAAWWLGSGKEEPRPALTEPSSDLPQHGRPLLRLVLFATFLSSAASFAYEVIFIRMLSLAVGSTLHAFELMLASFIAGIALGALWVRRRADRTALPLRMVGVLQILMGLTALLALMLYANAFGWVGFLMESLSRTDNAYRLFNLGTAAIAVLIMLPTAFFAGTTLPLFTVALLRDGQGESSIGRVYAWNTLGAILGVFAAIHFLIPALGLKLGMVVAATVDIAIGIMLLRMLAVRRRDFAGVGVAVAVLLAAVSATVFFVPFDTLRLSSGVYRSGEPRLDESNRVLFYRDGKTASVAVVYHPRGQLSITTNGKTDASIQMLPNRAPSSDEPTMILAGALPLAYRPDARTAAVIGFGSGLTTHTLLADPNLEQVDTIEIESAMVDGARMFAEKVERAYSDPRSIIIIDDAKSVLAARQQRYDIIVSEPSNPWISGVGALFSKEFYEFAPRFLADDGIFLQWLQLYEIDEKLVGSVLNAMLPAFRDVRAYLANSSDLLLVASMEPLTSNPDYPGVLQGALGDDLARMGITEPEHLAFRQVADARLLHALARLFENRPNSDYFPVLSLEAPRTRFRSLSAGSLIGLPALDLPLLEWLDVRQPPPLELDLPRHRHFLADDRANQARQLVHAITAPEDAGHQGLPHALRDWVLELRTVGASCAAPVNPETRTWLAARLLRLTHLVLPYIDAGGLEGVLIRPVWLACEPNEAGLAEALALLDAMGRRDPHAMEQVARNWFAGPAERPAHVARFDPMAMAALQFGLLAQGRRDEATRIEEEIGPEVRAEGDYGFARSLMMAWFDTGNGPAASD